MEEKKIIINERAENQILGQESVFGWEMYKKAPFNRFLYLKFYTYTLKRERNEDEVTQAHRDVENRWNKAFDEWSSFIQTTFKCALLAHFGGFLLLIIGYILVEAGLSSMTYRSTELPVSVIVGMVLYVIAFVFIVIGFVMLVKPAAKIKKMDKISKEMRQVNAVRKYGK